jgi:hypothetical protein
MGVQIKWQRGVFHVFVAKIKFKVGGLNGTPPTEIYVDDEFEYDGSVCKYAGAEFPQPGLRGAIDQEWAVPRDLADSMGVPRPRVASRNVAKAQSINTDLSKVQRQGGRNPLESHEFDEQTVLNVGDRAAAMDPVTRRGHLSAKNVRGMAIENSDVDDQEFDAIAPIKSPTKVVVDVLANPNAARAIESRSYTDGYGKFSGVRKTQSIEGISITTEVGGYGEGVEDTGTKVAEVRSMDKQKKSDDQKKQPVKVDKPVKVEKDPKEDPKLVAAKAVYSDFPSDWNFFGKTEDKLSKLKEIGPKPQLLNALWASESKSTKKALKEAYPKHSFG